MKVFIVQGEKRADYFDLPVPEIKDNEVLCKVAYNGICGTDLSIYTGESSFVKNGQITYPVRIGHEWSGTVAKIGSSVGKFAVGDRVVGDNAVGCGKCEHCLNGDFRKCRDLRSVGTINAWDGAFAEYIVMPERSLYKLPDDISLKSGCLIEPMTVAYSGIADCDINGKTQVAVIGCGSIGLASIPVVKAMGCDNVTFIGRNDDKLAVAKKLGAKEIINIRKDDYAAAVGRITGGRGFDVVIEASGAVEAVETCVAGAADRGTIVLLGFFEKPIETFEINSFVTKALTVKGISGGGMLPEIIEFMEKYHINIESVITEEIGFDEVKDYFENFKERKKNNIKVLVKIG